MQFFKTVSFFFILEISEENLRANLTQFMLLVKYVLLLICEMFTSLLCKWPDTIMFEKFGLLGMREFQLIKNFKAKHKQNIWQVHRKQFTLPLIIIFFFKKITILTISKMRQTIQSRMDQVKYLLGPFLHTLPQIMCLETQARLTTQRTSTNNLMTFD